MPGRPAEIVPELSAIAGALVAASAAAVVLLRRPRYATRPQRRHAVSWAGNRSAKRWYSSGRL
jgi:hypothetical protein